MRSFINIETGIWPIGALKDKFMLGPQLNKTIKIVQSEFKAYVERTRDNTHGETNGHAEAISRPPLV